RAGGKSSVGKRKSAGTSANRSSTAAAPTMRSISSRSAGDNWVNVGTNLSCSLLRFSRPGVMWHERQLHDSRADTPFADLDLQATFQRSRGTGDIGHGDAA